MSRWTQKDVDALLAKNPKLRVTVQGKPAKKRSKPSISDKYRSVSERAFASEGYLVLLDQFGFMAHDVTIYHEPISLTLEGGKYSPDFLILTGLGERLFVEVKGSSRTRTATQGRGYASTRAKLRAAAERYYFFRWFEARREQGTWEIAEVISKKRRLKGIVDAQIRAGLKSYYGGLLTTGDGASEWLTMAKTVLDLLEMVEQLEQRVAGF